MKINNYFAAALIALLALSAGIHTLTAGTSVLTYHNDNARTGANTNETLLTHANVNTNTFGLLMKYEVDAYVYTQPLYFSGLAIPGRGTRNAVFVGTENNSIYAFDAGSNADANGGLLWHAELGSGIDIVTNHEFGGRYHNNVYQDMLPRVGITGTPVIDPISGTLYVDAFTREVTATSTNFHHKIHALNITNGTEHSFGPVEVTAQVPGRGVGSVDGVLKFDPRQHMQRPALTLAGGILYVSYGSAADTDPYHGWIMGYDARTLQPLTNHVFNTTPNATIAQFGSHAAEGALWMGGGGLAVDADNNLYFEVANGSFSADPSLGNGEDYGDSFMKLSTTNNRLAVADFFTSFNEKAMQAADTDFGSGAPVVLPDEVGSPEHPHLIVGGDKASKIYLADRDHMGGYNSSNDNQLVQELNINVGQIFSTPVYYDFHLYYQGIRGVLKAFSITNGHINPTPASATKTSFSGFGTTPSLSANGRQDAIIWTIQSDGAVSSRPAILHAYNATNLALELYNSAQLPARDNPGNAVKMSVPTVADGKVFVGAQYALSVFGNGTFLPAPTFTPLGGDFNNSVTISLADAESGATIYYTLDGGEPTANSIRYAGPFALRKTADIKAIAIKSGAVSSGVSTASFVNTAEVGAGSGLLMQLWLDANSDATFATPAITTETNTPDILHDSTNFTARWSGSLQPQYNDTYALTTIATGGVRLTVNGRLLINDWTAHSSPATNRNSITLKAQQLYNVQLDYFQTGGGSIRLLWKRPSSEIAIIPQTQLYPFTNPPPAIVAVNPANDSTFTGSASVTFGVEAKSVHNPISRVDFFSDGKSLGTLPNSIYAPIYALTATGLSEGRHTLTAIATDGSGLSSTSAPIHITVNAGNGAAYGMTSREKISAFLKMPVTFNDTIPQMLSGTGAFADIARRTPASGLIPYSLNAPMWSDGAQGNYFLAVPNSGDLITPDRQMRLRPTNFWKFPDGTVFIKNLDLVVDETRPDAPRRRLETQILVRDINGAVYGVSYRWRADNSDADLLTSSATEDIRITTATGIRTRTWYYASPADCLVCHTPNAGYVLGVNTRQMNGNFTYVATGKTDNQIRTLNRLGLFSPAINEATIGNFPKLSTLANSTASLEDRARSYLDVNCAQCHRPGGVGNYDARYDTPLADQRIINAPAAVTLGLVNARIIAPKDTAHSVLFQRIISTVSTVKMPPLSHNEVDTQGTKLISDWINSLPAN